MDLITTAVIAYVTKDGIEKLLGPTFEYYGQGLKSVIEGFNVKAKENIQKIFERAIVKKGKDLEKDGVINPRIIKEIVFDGAFGDTNVIQEYYSGILASARTADGNDACIQYINVLKGLSSRQLKLHYVIYTKFLMDNKGKDCNLHTNENSINVYFSTEEIFKIFDFSTGEELDNFTSNDLPAIYHADLVRSYEFDTNKNEKQFKFRITLFGVSLFLQALGFGNVFAPKCLNDEKIEDIVNSVISLDNL